MGELKALRDKPPGTDYCTRAHLCAKYPRLAEVTGERQEKDLKALYEEGVFGTAIGFPTVPQGKARIRVMISAAHDRDDLGKGLDAFAKVGKKLGVIS